MIEQIFNPSEIESKWYQNWEKNNYFEPNGDKKEPYCIMLPPPNVTGSLHMGHAFELSIIDALIRYHRMMGQHTLWQVGTDHAGIATQMLVERKVQKEQNLTRQELGREAFVDKIWQWKEESGSFITNQMRRLGASGDWSRERFTMDEGLCEAVKTAFISLHEQGLIYRGKRLVNWDPVLKTAISDLEVINEEEQGSIWHIQYPLSSGDGHIVIATTRPETMLGDTAVAVHPQDSRYTHLHGQTVKIPLTDREIPIICDDYVSQDFGTGCLKITPGHDFNDYEVGQRHNLNIINILTPDAKLNSNVPEAYQGLDRFDARKQIIADLEKSGALVEVKDHKLNIPRGDRSGTIVEPYLTEQWYVKAKELAGPAIEAVKSGKIKFVPENWNKTYYHWLENIEDWCISRQLWWGHRIPAWFDQNGKVYVGEDETSIRLKYGLNADIQLKQDEDVLDTWFSSSLWPFSTLGWPEKTKELSLFYPNQVLVTGFDIIFFWVARMIMMGMNLIGDIPFKTIYIHGLIRSPDGQKMSKSKGNVIDPIDIIDGINCEDLIKKRTESLMQPHMAKKIAAHTKKLYPKGIEASGSDALRFTFAALAAPTRNINFDPQRLIGYRNFCNKIWNAARYVLMNTEQSDNGMGDEPISLSAVDHYMLEQYQLTIDKVHQGFKDFRLDFVAQALYSFIWHEYCDWYLELTKPVLTDKTVRPAYKRGAQKTLLDILEGSLRLLHPLMPFITEEIWQQVAPLTECDEASIMLTRIPQTKLQTVENQETESVNFVKAMISGVRNIRGEAHVSPNKYVTVLFKNSTETHHGWVEQHEKIIKSVGRISSFEWLDKSEKTPPSSTFFIKDLEVLVPLKGLIDIEKEQARLSKEIAKVQKEYDKMKSKLDNPDFISKAPQALVDKQLSRTQDLKDELVQLQNKQSELNNI